MKDFNQKEKEIRTIKQRTIRLNLSDTDCEKISKYAGKVNMTVGELLERFVEDMVDGTMATGKRNVELANKWYNRSVALFPRNTILRYLLNTEQDVDYFLTMFKEQNLYNVNQEKYNKDLSNRNISPTNSLWFQEEYRNFIKEFSKGYKGLPDIHSEVELCKKWLTEYESLMGNCISVNSGYHL